VRLHRTVVRTDVQAFSMQRQCALALPCARHADFLSIVKKKLKTVKVFRSRFYQMSAFWLVPRQADNHTQHFLLECFGDVAHKSRSVLLPSPYHLAFCSHTACGCTTRKLYSGRCQHCAEGILGNSGLLTFDFRLFYVPSSGQVRGRRKQVFVFVLSVLLR